MPRIQLLSTLLFLLQSRAPGSFERLRRLWWRLKYRRAAPQGLRGNCQDYAQYRAEISRWLDQDPDVSAAQAAVIELSDAALELPVDAEWALFRHPDAALAPAAASRLQAEWRRFPQAVCLYADHELDRPDGLDLQPLRAADPLAWAAGVGLPACFAVRLSALKDAQRAALAADWRAWLTGLALEADTHRLRHLPLPLCRLSQTHSRPPAPSGFIAAPQPWSSLAVIVPTRDGGAVLDQGIRSLLPAIQALSIPVEICIVDNGSRAPETLRILDRLSAWPALNVRVLRYDAPFNYAAINNWAARQIEAQVLLLLNDDVQAQDDLWLARMLSTLHQARVGVVGARLLYPDGRIQHAGVAMGLGGVAEHPGKGLLPEDLRAHRWHLDARRRVSAVTGACMLTTRALYSELGGLDERHLPVAFNDVDFCLRAGRAGWWTVIEPGATLIHHESLTRGADNTLAKHRRFTAEIAYMKSAWPELIDNDPYYSPHLSLHATDLSFRSPPSRAVALSRSASA